MCLQKDAKNAAARDQYRKRVQAKATSAPRPLGPDEKGNCTCPADMRAAAAANAPTAKRGKGSASKKRPRIAGRTTRALCTHPLRLSPAGAMVRGP